MALFEPTSPAQAQTIARLRQPQRFIEAGTDFILEGQVTKGLYTLFSGWAYRYKSLSDGRTQILSFLLPGDFLGLQQKLTDVSEHGVRALTDIWLCPFPVDTIETFQAEHSKLAYNVTWISASEKGVLDESLLSVGRRTAEERVAALLLMLYKRVRAIQGPGAPAQVPFPLTQSLIAQAMGLSLVHTHRVMRRLQKLGLHRIEDGKLEILNARALARLADVWNDGKPAVRPLI